MTDRPILFNAQMVRALFDDRKTQTRRVLNPQPKEMVLADQEIMQLHKKTPYAVGDRLWVREAWRIGAWDVKPGGGVAVDYLADNHARKEWLGGDMSDEMFERLVSQSQSDAKKSGQLVDRYYEYAWSPGNSPCRIRPSTHMPRWASRTTLTVTDVRVQRVQDISEADAIAEGCRPFFDKENPDKMQSPNGGEIEMLPYMGPRVAFQRLWDSINAKRGFGWDENPWVMAVNFEVKKQNIDEVCRDCKN